MTSKNIIRVLERNEQKHFRELALKCDENFKKNCYKILEEEGNYFLTTTHGDAQKDNFFYDKEIIFNSDGLKISKGSFHRVTMIDFASIIKTYGNIGDPAEDVGRFAGSLWDLATESNDLELANETKIARLQEKFFQTYLEKIMESGIFLGNEEKEAFKKIFKENYNFYKLRFYRAVFNTEKDRAIKKQILESWIKENLDLAGAAHKDPRPGFVAEESHLRKWKPADGGTYCDNLPPLVEEFITSAAESAEISYLTRLWEMLEDTGNVTLSSTAAIAGMGGVGKTTLAAAYAHEALTKQAYNLIYWLDSGSDISLENGYKSLLREMDVSIENENKNIIELVKQEMGKPERGKCLLIYDNAHEPDFLKDKIPQNKDIHILITSRFNKEWWGNPALNINVFRPKDSLEYLFNITGLKRNSENQKVAEDLAEALDHFPLALAHAAYYLKMVGRGMISEKHCRNYLKELEDDIQSDDLGHFEGKINEFNTQKSKITHENLIGKTLTISAKKFLPLAKELMDYCAYLDPNAIDEEIFADNFSDKGDEFKEALQQLSSLSLIKREGQKFFIHRLVQLVLRNSQKSESLEKSANTFSGISSIFQKLFIKNIVTEQSIFKLTENYYHFLKLWEYSQESSQIDFPTKVKEERESLQWMFMLLATFIEDNDFTEKQLKRFFEVLQKKAALSNIDIREIDIPEWLFKEVKIPRVQFGLGQVYFSLIQKPEKAYEWITKAAEAEDGYARAQFLLGIMFANGHGVEQDWSEALKWWEKASEFAPAQCLLGAAYYEDENKVEYKFENVEQLLPGPLLSAISQVQGYSIAALRESLQSLLGIDFNGNNNKKDNAIAFNYYEQAAKKGFAIAQGALGMMYYNGNGVEQNMTKSFEYYKRAAKQRLAIAQNAVG